MVCPAALATAEPPKTFSPWQGLRWRHFRHRDVDAAREVGASDPERLGEQLALLLDGASARSRVLDSDILATAAAIANVLVDNAIPTT
ncbi:hypothetical protein [Rhodococcoides fascians]|uniref:hypothetical protein n=1 Tax=Rhodococcoides fascians TaxID=1828 RepID=UPI0024BB6385|nr:hypothetical protein [Rhodococcus fascians]MDJ0412693.1 hypothetical protein [Rhodococcus fascians]